MRFGFRKRGIEMFVVLAMTILAGAAHAQSSTTTEKKSFEILSVDGNVLVDVAFWTPLRNTVGKPHMRHVF